VSESAADGVQTMELRITTREIECGEMYLSTIVSSHTGTQQKVALYCIEEQIKLVFSKLIVNPSAKVLRWFYRPAI